MLDADFFEFTETLGASRHFTEFVQVLDDESVGVFGDGSYGVMAYHKISHVPFFVGKAGKLDFFRQLAERLRKHCRYDGCEEVEGGVPDAAFLNEYLGSAMHLAEEGHGVRVMTLSEGLYHRVFFVAIRSGLAFSEPETERFKVLEVVGRHMLSSMAVVNFDHQVRQQLFAYRAECPAAYFQYDGEEVVPMNHQAVEYSEKYWDADDPMRELDDETREALDEVLNGSWQSPVESVWSPVSLDLGGGVLDAFVIPRYASDAVVMIQSRPRREAMARASDYLTKRQREIMDWIAEGKTSSEVATILGISSRTVEKHLEAIFQRLGVENRITAVRRYLELQGLIEAEI